MVQIGDVADGESEDLDLREFLVGRQCRQQFAQLGERHVERLHPDAFACRVRRPVLLGGPPSPPPLLATQPRLRLVSPRPQRVARARLAVVVVVRAAAAAAERRRLRERVRLRRRHVPEDARQVRRHGAGRRVQGPGAVGRRGRGARRR